MEKVPIILQKRNGTKESVPLMERSIILRTGLRSTPLAHHSDETTEYSEESLESIIPKRASRYMGKTPKTPLYFEDDSRRWPGKIDRTLNWIMKA